MSHGRFKNNEAEYDTKYAMHMLRLGFQGVELLTTGRLNLPMVEPYREYLLGVRQGKNTRDEVLQCCTDIESQLKALLDTTSLPDQPDTKRVEAWMLETYYTAWQSTFGHQLNMKFKEMEKR